MTEREEAQTSLDDSKLRNGSLEPSSLGMMTGIYEGEVLSAVPEFLVICIILKYVHYT